MIRDQAPPPSPRLLAELDRRGIAYQLGRVIVDTARADEAQVREALEAAAARRQLIYNRAALMLLPAGLSKGTGVRQVFQELGLSPHDVLALGDAENDLDLFDACGWAGCPENAVPELRARADWTFPGIDGEGIARAIDGPILGGWPRGSGPGAAPPDAGWAAGSADAVFIPERDVNVLIHGESLPSTGVRQRRRIDHPGTLVLLAVGRARTQPRTRPLRERGRSYSLRLWSGLVPVASAPCWFVRLGTPPAVWHTRRQPS
jgi:hypothetical protein